MGTEAHAVVVGPEELVAYAEVRLNELESLWTRFDDSSELMRLNVGRALRVSDETLAVVERAVHAWTFTGGLFDPTVHTAMLANGYDRSFERMSATRLGVAGPAPGCGGIFLDRSTRIVILPEDVTLDLGGIGKGFAADLLALELIQRGADGALVNVGGDLRAVGEPPDQNGWVVALEDGELTSIDHGGVATSSTARRRWNVAGQSLHHLIDPRTGRPSRSEVGSVTVFAAEAWWAEVLAKAALIGGPIDGQRLLDRAGVAGVMRRGDPEARARRGAAEVRMEAYRIS